MKRKAKAKLRDVVDEWAETEGLSQDDVLSIIVDLMGSHGLALWAQHEHHNDNWRIKYDDFERGIKRLNGDEHADGIARNPDGEKLKSPDWNNIKLYAMKGPMQHFVLLADLEIWRADLQKALIDLGLPLPVFWFPDKEVSHDEEKSEPQADTPTEAANRTRSRNKEDWQDALLTFVHEVFETAQQKGLPWAKNRETILYKKEDFFKGFRERHPRLCVPKDERLAKYLNEQDIQFTAGRKNAGVASVEDLLKS